MPLYEPRHPSRSETVDVRGLPYHVRLWGEPSTERPPLVLLHGWMDVSASWQFVVDALAESRFVVAPDWRGFGRTPGGPGGPVDNHWMPDYLADLEWLLDHFAGDTPVDLVGHSMGGNIAMQYGGVRPERVRRLVNLEGFGMPALAPQDAPRRHADWIDQLKRLHRGELALQTYDGPEGVARRLTKTNPRIAPDKALWLARHWAAPVDGAAGDGGRGGDGGARWAILGDAAHKVVNAQIYRADEAVAAYACIAAPVLAVEAADDSFARWKGRYTRDEYRARLAAVPDARIAVVQDAGHMLHHDQPLRVARLIEDFLRPSPSA